MHVDGPSFYISSDEDTIVMIEAADMFVKNDRNHVLFHASYFYEKGKALTHRRHARHLEKYKQTFSTFALFLIQWLNKQK